MANVNLGHINPFISATIESFKTMVMAELKPGKIRLKDNTHLTNDIIGVIGVIGLSGEVKGAISLCFTLDVA